MKIAADTALGGPRATETTRALIPRRIIQTGPSDLPLHLKAAAVSVRLLHPSFDYVFFDDERVEAFMEDCSAQHRQIYRSFPFRIQKFDFFRYLAVYRLGGFYLDLDVFLACDLEKLVSSHCVFPFEELSPSRYLWQRYGMDWQIGNYAFGAPAGDPFLGAIIDNCVKAQQSPKWVTPMLQGIPRPFRSEFYVLNTTGPGLVSRTLAENPHLARGVHVLFPDDVRNPKTWHQFGGYGVHQMSGSWRGHKNFFSRSLLRLWDTWTLRRLIAESRNRGATRDVTAMAARVELEKRCSTSRVTRSPECEDESNGRDPSPRGASSAGARNDRTLSGVTRRAGAVVEHWRQPTRHFR